VEAGIRRIAALATALALAGVRAAGAEAPDPGAGPAPGPLGAQARPFQPPELLALPTRPTERSASLAVAESLAAGATVWGAARAWGLGWARLSFSAARSNLTGPWVFDASAYEANQLGHPYQGHLAFAAARSCGFTFWQSAAFPLVSSTLWELFAETGRPSINDEITTPVGGAFAGEVLYRLSQWVLDGGGLAPSRARRAAAWLLSPTAGTTQLLAGNRFRTRPEAPIPARLEARLGASLGRYTGATGDPARTGGLVSGSIQVTHGPPVGDWRLRDPFDHFDLLGSINVTTNPWVVLQVRGLLAGSALGSPRSRGFWGLWGLYDFTTLKAFRASASALGVGVTGRHALGRALTLEGTAIAGGGYGAAGTRARTPATPDYHYGAGGLAILDGRLLAGDRVAVRVALRQYYVGGRISPEAKGRELVALGTLGATLRLAGRHAVGIDFTQARRWATFPNRDDAFGTFSQAIAYYAWMNDATMGPAPTALASRH
jgi:hypothetical protein